MNVWRLKKYHLRKEPAGSSEASEGGQRLWIWGDGEEFYQRKLIEAFPGLGIVSVKGAKSSGYTWCARVDRAAPEIISGIEACLQAFNRTLCIESSLDECFALGWHSKPGKPGKPELTTLGQWISMAKSYDVDPDSRGSLPVAGLIAEQMAEFVRRHPLYRFSDGIVAALASNPEKAFDLPSSLAGMLSADCGIPFWDQALFKIRRTAQMKFCPTLEDKLDNVTGSVGVVREWVEGRKLILLDDILESGATLNETARALREGGAAGIYGLAATKTLKRAFS